MNIYIGNKLNKDIYFHVSPWHLIKFIRTIVSISLSPFMKLKYSKSPNSI